jgi:hypothetical protein
MRQEGSYLALAVKSTFGPQLLAASTVGMKLRLENSHLVVEVTHSGDGYLDDGKTADTDALARLFADLLARLHPDQLAESDVAVAEAVKPVFFPNQFNPRKHEPPLAEDE